MATHQPMPRRAFLQGAVPLTLALPLAAVSCVPPLVASGADPHPAWWEQWKRDRDAWTYEAEHNRGPNDEDSPEAERLWAERDRIGDLIEATVARTPEGLMAQVEYLFCEFMEEGTCAAMPEANAVNFVGVIRAGLRGMA